MKWNQCPETFTQKYEQSVRYTRAFGGRNCPHFPIKTGAAGGMTVK